MEEKRYPHINKALRHDLDRLLEDCFGDLPITAQRLLKAYCMRYDKASCVYRERKVVIHENMPELRNLQVNVDKRHLSPCLEQVQIAQETVDNIVGILPIKELAKAIFRKDENIDILSLCYKPFGECSCPFL